MHLRLMRQLVIDVSSYPSTCTNKWLPTVSIVCCLSLPRKKKSLEWGCSYAWNEAQKAHPQIISWLFWMQHLSHYGARLFEEERKKMNNSDFRPFQVSQLRTSFRYYYCFCILGQPISSSKCLWTLTFGARWNYCRVNANTLIGAAILFPGHPYIWATLLWAHN